MRAWGFWPASLAAELAQAVLAVGRTAAPPFRLLLDAAQLKPQDDEAQQAFRSLFKGLSGMGLSNAAIVVTNAITKMQFKHITRDLTSSHWVYVATAPADAERAADATQGERK